MANLNFPRGFIPIGGCNSVREYNIAAANPQIGENDLVERRADGFVYPASVTTITPIGIAAESKAANSGGRLKVYDSPDLLLEAQVDDASVAAHTDFDLNYDIIASAPNAVSGRSTMQIDGSTKAATATLPIKILRIREIVTKERNVLGNHVAVECIINNHLHKSTGVIG